MDEFLSDFKGDLKTLTNTIKVAEHTNEIFNVDKLFSDDDENSPVFGGKTLNSTDLQQDLKKKQDDDARELAQIIKERNEQWQESRRKETLSETSELFGKDEIAQDWDSGHRVEVETFSFKDKILPEKPEAMTDSGERNDIAHQVHGVLVDEFNINSGKSTFDIQCEISGPKVSTRVIKPRIPKENASQNEPIPNIYSFTNLKYSTVETILKKKTTQVGAPTINETTPKKKSTVHRKHLPDFKQLSNTPNIKRGTSIDEIDHRRNATSPINPMIDDILKSMGIPLLDQMSQKLPFTDTFINHNFFSHRLRLCQSCSIDKNEMTRVNLKINICDLFYYIFIIITSIGGRINTISTKTKDFNFLVNTLFSPQGIVYIMKRICISKTSEEGKLKFEESINLLSQNNLEYLGELPGFIYDVNEMTSRICQIYNFNLLKINNDTTEIPKYVILRNEKIFNKIETSVRHLYPKLIEDFISLENFNNLVLLQMLNIPKPILSLCEHYDKYLKFDQNEWKHISRIASYYLGSSTLNYCKYCSVLLSVS